MPRTRTIKHEIDIDAPRDQIWEVLARLDSFGDYSPVVKGDTILSEQRDGVGAERRCDAYRPGHIDERVVAWDEGARIALEVVGGMPIKGTGVWTLTGTDPTNVTFQLDYAPRFGPIGFVMDKMMMAREMDKGFASNLAGLKAHVEDGAIISDKFIETQ